MVHNPAGLVHPGAPSGPGGAGNGNRHKRHRGVVEAALRLAAARPWRQLALAEIASEADISLLDLRRHYGSKTEILFDFSRLLDETVLSHPADAADPPRDRLFEVLMARFDALAPYKEGVRALARDARHGRLEAALSLVQLPCSMGWMLEAAGIPAGGLGGTVRAHVLGLVYLKTLRVWLDETEEDLPKTMAELDRSLDRAAPLLRLDDFAAAPDRREEPRDSAAQSSPSQTIPGQTIPGQTIPGQSTSESRGAVDPGSAPPIVF